MTVDRLHFDLQGMRPAIRASAWKDFVRERFLTLDLAEVDLAQHNSIECWPGEDVFVSCVRAGQQKVIRTRANTRADGLDYFFLNVQLDGVCDAEQGGRKVRMQPGQAALFDGGVPYQLGFDGPFRQLVVHLPRSLLAEFTPVLGAVTASKVATTTQTGAFALQSAQALMHSVQDAAEAPRRLYAETAFKFALTDVLAHHGTGLDMATLRETTRVRAIEMICRHARDPDLTPPSLARRLGCSRRHLYDAFEGSGQSVAGAIWERRLAMARQMIGERSASGWTIDQIAAACGFQTSSHFVARFKRRYGMTPAKLRRGLH